MVLCSVANHMTADCSFRTIATSLVLWMSYNLGCLVPNIRQIWAKTRFIKGGVRLRNMKPSQTHPQLAGNMASHSSHWDRMRSRSGKSFAMRQPRRQLGPSMIENPRTEPHDIPTSSYIILHLHCLSERLWFWRFLYLWALLIFQLAALQETDLKGNAEV